MKTIFFLSLTLSFTTLLTGQQPFSRKEFVIQQTVTKMFEALSDRDSIALKSYCAPDITLFEYGQVWNLDTLIRKAIVLNRATDFKRSNTFDFVSIKVDGNQAWATYRLNSVITTGKKETVVNWLETVILAKQKDKWRINHLHSTLIKRD